MSKSNLPADPLAHILAQAVKKLPKKTGEVAAVERRMSGSGTVLLLDTSGSMSLPVAPISRTSRMDRLRENVVELLASLTAPPTILAFSSRVVKIDSVDELVPGGGTDLEAALLAACKYKPELTVVVSDGEPDDEDDAFAAAEKLGGRISTIFCGPESSREAQEFLRRLASLGKGVYGLVDLQQRHALTNSLRGMLLLECKS